MKNLLIALALISTLSFFTSCEKDTYIVAPSAAISIEEKDFSNYSKLDVSSEFQVFVTFSDTEEKIEVEANEDLHERIIVGKDGKTLEIRLKNNTNVQGDATLNVYITTKEINSFNISGESRIQLENELQGNDIDVTLSGESEFTGELDVEKLDANLVGSSKLDLMGNADDFKLTLTGDSEAKNYSFVCKDLDITLSGESEAYLTVMNTIDVSATGESTLHYKGEAVIISQSLTGNSKVKKED